MKDWMDTDDGCDNQRRETDQNPAPAQEECEEYTDNQDVGAAGSQEDIPAENAGEPCASDECDELVNSLQNAEEAPMNQEDLPDGTEMPPEPVLQDQNQAEGLPDAQTQDHEAVEEKPSVKSKHKERVGLWVYAVVMTGVFALSLGLLLGVLTSHKGERYNWSDHLYGVSERDPVSRADVAGVEESKRSVVVIQTIKENGTGTGTGVILSEDGYIATNHHVIEDAGKIRVSFFDGRHAYATVVGSSPMDDLAVIKVDLTGLPVATFADSAQCYVGQTVYAIGTPAGSDFSWTTTKGIISYVNREVKQYADDGTMTKKLRLLQTDAQVNPGNSGGPLVDADGHVVGIVSMKLGGEYTGIGFAIPSDGALEILEAIRVYGNADSVNSSLSFKRPVLGIVGVYVEAEHDYIMENREGRLYDVTEQDAKAVHNEIVAAGGLPSEVKHASASGVLVVSITEGLGADGLLQPDDIIVAVQGTGFDTMTGMMDVINTYYAGDTVSLDVYRDGQTLILDLVLSAQAE